MTSEEHNVLEANQRFYHALQELDLAEMEAIWLPESWVQCVHPGWNLLEGWEAIRESWKQIFENTHFLRLTVGVQQIRVENSMAWVCCTEKITSVIGKRFEAAYAQATNLFERRDGAWRLVHHHGSLVPNAWAQEAGADLVQ